MKNKPFIYTACILAVGLFLYLYTPYNSTKPKEVSKQTQTPVQLSSKNSSTPQTTKIIFPKSFSLKIPFSPQAPTANWDELHNEACEETSSIMAHAFLTGRTESVLPADFVEGEITKITEWEKQRFGYYLDIDSEETVTLLQDFYGLHAKIVTNYTEDNLKQELQDGHVIIFPANGKLLENPNFKNGGPLYHMFIIRGYTEDTYLTNDPGTRKGLNYPYSYETLYKANGNYDHQTNKVDTTKKHYISVWK